MWWVRQSTGLVFDMGKLMNGVHYDENDKTRRKQKKDANRQKGLKDFNLESLEIPSENDKKLVGPEIEQRGLHRLQSDQVDENNTYETLMSKKIMPLL